MASSAVRGSLGGGVSGKGDVPGGLESDLCDFFVKREFEGIEFTSPYSASVLENCRTDLTKGVVGCFCQGGTSGNPMDGYRDWLLEKFGSDVLPAFLVKGRKIFVEVKLDGKPDLSEEQTVGFGKALEKGYRIFVVVPKICLKPRAIEAEDFECYELKRAGKRKKLSLSEVKQEIKKEGT
ncbi:MAG: hypothetical protein JW727_00245 [Candidatus Aenigmarchaeota archaeon]|nr:hypothetical protein [Candidatus Aenigmarchaeota archaeon]